MKINIKNYSHFVQLKMYFTKYLSSYVTYNKCYVISHIFDRKNNVIIQC